MSAGVLDLHDAEIARLDESLVALGAPHDIDLVVHSTRKGIKRLRAHLRLARAAIEETAYRAEDTDLSEIGRLLAPARDAHVIGQTLGALESTEGWKAASDYIQAHHRSAIDELLAGPLREARTRLGRVRRRWSTHPMHLDAGTVTAAVVSTYRRGRFEQKRAMDTARARAFHQWRKRVKYLRYQLEAIGAAEASVAALLELGDTLGFEHDHTVFIDFCDEHITMCPDRRDRYVLIDRAERRRDQLRASALSTGVYAQDPGVFVATVLNE
ncbi:MAG: CHAD domain-containing protein [Acidimicrobiia bacterium]|nr:MAG: CHAD domain-containing protein [Acidimicrobiia bacterium]